jgi:hypothetical protein
MKLFITTILLLVSLSLKAPPMDYQHRLLNIKIWYDNYLLEQQWQMFALRIRYKESYNNYDTINNKRKYFGAYQFNEKLLRKLGYNISKKQFKLNKDTFTPLMQDKAFFSLCKHNDTIMKRYIKYFNNKEINGIFINKAAILAACHLAGPTNVKKFLSSNGKKNFKDGNGTRVSDYMKQFNKYSI